MRSLHKLSGAARALALGVGLCAIALLAGCGMSGAPQPPSLNLPEPATDLTASRAGSMVALAWTMPRRDTSKVALKGNITARICRSEGHAPCAAVATVEFAPGANGTFSDTLPSALASGDPRALHYSVELVNKRGRSAGQSNPAAVLAGQAPAPVEGLNAEVRKEGVVLSWTPGPQEPYPTLVRLERTLLTPQAPKPAQGPLAAPAEPAKQNLLVPPGGLRGRALDEIIQFGETYEYRAQRVARLTVEGKEIELDGPFSSPIRVEAKNVFAPAAPTGLAAVAASGENGAAPAIDLNWQPNTDPDLAGYAVYRREAGQPESAWQRISPAQPVVGPGFRDSGALTGRAYEYAVTAIGGNGRESEKSAPAQEAVPEP